MIKPFALTTGDPAFDPRCPVTINGYPYFPAAPAANAGGDHALISDPKIAGQDAGSLQPDGDAAGQRPNQGESA